VEVRIKGITEEIATLASQVGISAAKASSSVDTTLVGDGETNMNKPTGTATGTGRTRSRGNRRRHGSRRSSGGEPGGDKDKADISNKTSSEADKKETPPVEKKRSRGGRRKRRGQNKRGGIRGDRRKGEIAITSPVRQRALAQIEYYFSDDRLCQDVFLRQHMDCEGYVPAAFVFNFPSLRALALPYRELLDVVNTSQRLEVDYTNETVRVTIDYKKWLFPNPDGTRGAPRWIKALEDAAQPIEEEPPREQLLQPKRDQDSISSENSSPSKDASADVPSLVATDCCDSISEGSR